MFEKQLPFLREGELPGPTYWNSVIRFLRRITSRSSDLVINERPGGGAYFDLNITKAIQASAMSSATLYLFLDADHSTWSLSGGSIRIAPSTVVTVNAVANQAVTATTCIWIEWNDTTATVQTGNSFPNLVNMTNKVCRTPIATITVADGAMTVSRHHPGGDICVYDRPWILVDGYANGTKAYRTASAAGTEQYVTPKQCPQQGDASDSDSESNGGV